LQTAVRVLGGTDKRRARRIEAAAKKVEELINEDR
jgi:hypothetical protein